MSTGDATERVRYDLYDKSKLIVDECGNLIKNMLHGAMHDEYILKTARNFAVKEPHVTHTNQAINQLEFIHKELTSTHFSTEKHLQTMSQSNETTKATLAQLEKLKSTLLNSSSTQ